MEEFVVDFSHMVYGIFMCGDPEAFCIKVLEPYIDLLQSVCFSSTPWFLLLLS